MAGEKTESATPKKRNDERKKGNIFQSKDLVSVVSIVVMFQFLKYWSPRIIENISSYIRRCFELAGVTSQLNLSDVSSIFSNAVLVLLIVAMPMLLVAAALGIAVTGIQTRFLISWDVIKFKFSRLNPLEGIKKLFSLRSLVELAKSLIKISALGFIIYYRLSDKIPLMPRLMYMTTIQATMFLGDIVMSIVTTVAVIFIFVAAFDYIYQWWEYEKNLRMSKQDIKDEYKMTEGDPQIKSKIRERQRQQAMNRMMQNVPMADVIIRNPTHFAVALKYDSKQNAAPIVIAKGADHIALKIISLAEKSDIFVMENRELARNIYASIEIDKPITDDFYGPVAEILAFVYNLKNKKTRF